MKHIHADKILQFAQDAQETPYPWERWMVKYPGGVFEPADECVDMDWDANNEYERINARIKRPGVVALYDPREKKKLYLWAWKDKITKSWKTTDTFMETEEEARNDYLWATDIKRTNTFIEV